MAKVFYCSSCGDALEVKIKAIKGDTVRVVAQHECSEQGEGFDLIKHIEESQDVTEVSGEFVRKLDDLSPDKEPRVPGWPQDERPQSEDLRKTTEAPVGAAAHVGMVGTDNLGGREETPDPRTIGEPGSQPGDGDEE